MSTSSREKSDRSIRGGRARSGSIELQPARVVPMTDEQKEAAIQSLAVLLDTWVRGARDGSTTSRRRRGRPAQVKAEHPRSRRQHSTSRRRSGAATGCQGRKNTPRSSQMIPRSPELGAPNWTVLERMSAGRRACAVSQRPAREASTLGLWEHRGPVTRSSLVRSSKSPSLIRILKPDVDCRTSGRPSCEAGPPLCCPLRWGRNSGVLPDLSPPTTGLCRGL